MASNAAGNLIFCIKRIEISIFFFNIFPFKGEDMLMSALQCFFYPCLVPLLRNKVREQKGIEVRFNVILPCQSNSKTYAYF
jgi:hypothetical protein